MDDISLFTQCLLIIVNTSSDIRYIVLNHVDGFSVRYIYCVTTVAFPILGLFLKNMYKFMLTYKNLAKDIVLKDLRNLKYANSDMYYGFNNTISLNMELSIDVLQISLQANIFCREMLNLKGKIDFKRFLGSYQSDWPRLLHNVYVYDRIKCIYYGINLTKMPKLPENMHSFPGNILLTHLISKNTFRFDTKDEQPFSFFVKLVYETSSSCFDPIFTEYPDLRTGMSDNPNIISYVNIEYEPIMQGLYYAKEYLASKAKDREGNNNLFEIHELNSTKIESFTSGEVNPIANSFLNDDGDKFYFVLPPNESKPQALRFNASVFLPRAIGLRSNQLILEDNNFYKVARRDTSSDIFTRDEVFSITGLKSEIIPDSRNQIMEYLGINSFKLERESLIEEQRRRSGGSEDTQSPIAKS